MIYEALRRKVMGNSGIMVVSIKSTLDFGKLLDLPGLIKVIGGVLRKV